MSSDYDGQDQAYQDLLDECEELRGHLAEICTLIHYQDRWLDKIIKLKLYKIEGEEE